MMLLGSNIIIYAAQPEHPARKLLLRSSEEKLRQARDQ
jgi:hypothetical protein